MKIFLSILLACLLSATVKAQEAVLSHNSNLRSGPSSSSKVLGSLPVGIAVTITSKYPRSGYVKVKSKEDGRTGWVLKRNVTEAGSKEKKQIDQPASPSAGTSSTLAGDVQIYPKSDLTPGKEDPRVTQDNIAKNICKKGWSTESVRPPASDTDKIKLQTMQAYGFTDAPGRYELDHLISLQNGGCPACVENLWPEAYGDKGHPMTQNERAKWNSTNRGSTKVLSGALEKDLVENHIHDEICLSIPNAKMSSFSKKYPATVSVTLKRGQEILAKDWYSCYRNMMDGNKPCE